MPVASQPTTVHVALIGNPNTGKTTLFNALCGVRQRVGNYPGVTVEKIVGVCRDNAHCFQVLDLPGTYSLAPRSPDEMVAVDVLLNRRGDTRPADVVVCIVDASNLERNFYLVSQVLELECPVIIVLNMMDVAERKGVTIDVRGLQTRLGVPVVALQAHKQIGLAELKQTLAESVDRKFLKRASPFPIAFQREVKELLTLCERTGAKPPRYLAERLLLDSCGYLERAEPAICSKQVLEALPAARDRLAASGCPIPAVEATSRYAWVAELFDGLVQRAAHQRLSASDRIDRLLTHKFWGAVALVFAMAVMFQSVFYLGGPASAAIDALKDVAAGWVSQVIPPGALSSLLVQGVLEGVGGVLVFLPQIFLLFLFIAILEDCGYMARTAYLMDRLMSQIGLNGRSFIPLLSSFACAIPGIMAARVIENRRDRLVTILVAPLMSCSARLPVYTLLIAAFIPSQRYLGGLVGLQGLTMAAMYLIGVLAAILVAFVLKRTLLKAETPPFVMELPSYKWPSPSVVMHRVLERGWSFVRRAGTLIFAVAIVVWAAAYYPHDPAHIPPSLLARQAELDRRMEKLAQATTRDAGAQAPIRLEALRAQRQAVDYEIQSAYLSQSYLGQAGRWIEPIVRPLGWDWKIGCAVIASFPAREIIVATLGVIYTLGDEQHELSVPLHDRLRHATWDHTQQPVFTLPVALSMMVFVALCAQCAATLAVIAREAGGWRWAAFTFVYMTVFAYLAALLTYQVGTWLQIS